MSDHVGPDQVLSRGILDFEGGERFVVTSAVVVATALDPETGEEHMFYRADDDSPIWKQIGMLQVALDGYRRQAGE